MTDFEDRPNTNSSGATGTGGEAPDESDARWFRDAVAPVVDAKPVVDAWDDIRSRATGDAPAIVRLVPTPGTDRRRPPRRRIALLAAAVLAVAGIGGAMALTRDDGGGDGETVVATPPDAEADATGWYVPDTMPEGWELESVETDWLDWGAAATFSCPCETTSWISDGDAAMVLSKYVGDLPDGLWGTPGDAATTVELGEGVNGDLHEIGPVTIIQWGLDAHIWSLSARGPTSDQVVHAATAVVADPSLATPPLDGFSRLVDVTVPAGVRGYHSVLATFVNAHSGRRASFGLIPEGFDPGTSFLLTGVPRSAAVFESQDLPLFRFDVDEGGDAGERTYFGHWPGAEVFIGRYAEPAASEPMTESDLGWLAASLRPATRAQWEAFLDTATGSVDGDVRTDRLTDLVVHDGDAVSGLDVEPRNTPATTEATAVANTTDGPDAPNTRLIAIAKSLVAGDGPFPVDDLFAPSLEIGLDFQTVDVVDVRDLADPDAWVIGTSYTEYYAGRTPPFSALEMLAGTEEFAVTDGAGGGCPGSTDSPTPPPFDDSERLVTITPADSDSCLDWYAIMLVLDEQDLITAVHLYLSKP